MLCKKNNTLKNHCNKLFVSEKNARCTLIIPTYLCNFSFIALAGSLRLYYTCKALVKVHTIMYKDRPP